MVSWLSTERTRGSRRAIAAASFAACSVATAPLKVATPCSFIVTQTPAALVEPGLPVLTGLPVPAGFADPAKLPDNVENRVCSVAATVSVWCGV